MLSRKAGESSEEQELYRSYQSDLAGERMARSLRSGILVVVGLNSLFVALDYFAYPDRLGLLVAVHCARPGAR